METEQEKINKAVLRQHQRNKKISRGGLFHKIKLLSIIFGTAFLTLSFYSFIPKPFDMFSIWIAFTGGEYYCWEVMK